MAYHYKESGLDNVFLENGYSVHRTPYGEGVSIHETDQLHRAITRWLIQSPMPLTGAELRFLRLEMELTQKNLAAILGEQEQTIRRWEKGRTRALAGAADRILRALANEFIDGDGSIRRMLLRIADARPSSSVKRASFDFSTRFDGWRFLQ